MLRPPASPLTDGQIRLEPLTEEHIPGFVRLAADPATQRFTYAPAGPDPDPNFPARWVARYTTGWQDGSRAGFAIVDATDGAFLGMVVLVTVDLSSREAEVGYVIAPEARGRGVALRGLRLIADWALDTLGLERLEARIDAANDASLGVVERAGFTRDGIMRSVYFKDGIRSDLAVYSLLASDRPGEP